MPELKLRPAERLAKSELHSNWEATSNLTGASFGWANDFRAWRDRRGGKSGGEPPHSTWRRSPDRRLGWRDAIREKRVLRDAQFPTNVLRGSGGYWRPS